MKERNLVQTVILMIAIILLLTGCGRSAWIASKDEEDRKNVTLATEAIGHSIITYDSKELYELFDEQFQNDELYEEISGFNEKHGDVTEIYVDFIGMRVQRLSETPYTSYGGVNMWLFTDDNIYSLLLDFNISKDADIDIVRLWIATAKTEATENKNFMAKYRFSDDEVFEYADYYDADYVGEYRFIRGDVLSWDPEASHIRSEDIKEEDWVGKPIDDFVELYGAPGAEFIVVKNANYDFYYEIEDEKYLMITITEKDIIDEIRETDKIGYGRKGIEELDTGREMLQ